jgi:hypothetical protein
MEDGFCLPERYFGEAKMIRLSLALAACMLAAACNTPYQENGLTGGVVAAPITSDTYRISARGNGYTDSTTIQDYVLLKAAETTLAAGRTHFMIVNAADSTSRSIGQTPGTVSTSLIGNTAFTTYNPGMTYDVVKPGSDVIIQIGTLPSGQQVPGAFNAQEVFDSINPRVRRPEKR